MATLYSEILTKAIEESGLRLVKIAERAGNICGEAPTMQYLSRVKNGRVPPAGDELNKALATVLGIEPMLLRTAAYSEKIPADVLSALQEAR